MSAESVDHPPVFKTDRPLIFAHRGGARLAPENTLAAIDNGIKLGSDGLEIDVQLSSDGIPVVIHDPTLDRTTNRTGPVRHFTAAELARVDAGPLRQARLLEPFALLWITLAYQQGMGRDIAFRLMRR